MLINYLKAMAIFAEVVRQGSFSKAGLKLDMPRGKVSEQVTRLEVNLKVKLLQRSTRKVSITDEGQALYEKIGHFQACAKEAVQEVESFNEQIQGKIKITCTQDHLDAVLLPLLKEFNQSHPKVQFDLVVTEQALSIIDQGIDIAIRSGLLPDSNLISIPLNQGVLKLYAAADMPVIPKTIDELEQFAWLSLASQLNHGSSKVDLQLIKNKKTHYLQLSVQHSASNIAAYLSMLGQGFGIGLLAQLSAQPLVKQGRLQPVLADYNGQDLPLSLIYPARKNMAKRTRLLIDFIKQRLLN